MPLMPQMTLAMSRLHQSTLQILIQSYWEPYNLHFFTYRQYVKIHIDSTAAACMCGRERETRRLTRLIVVSLAVVARVQWSSSSS